MTNELNLPWRVVQSNPSGQHQYLIMEDREHGEGIVQLPNEANAAYICKAVNLHHELVQTLEAVISSNGMFDLIKNIDQAQELLERAKS